MEFIKFILICLGVLFIIDVCLDQPQKRPLTIQDCVHSGDNIDIGCVQRVNAQYGY